jgi:hypothetical protein
VRNIFRLALIAAGFDCVLPGAVHTQAQGPAPSSGSIYDGLWSFEYRNATRPGGTRAQCAGYVVTQNILFSVVKRRFQVNKKRTALFPGLNVTTRTTVRTVST